METCDRPGWLFTDTVPSSGQAATALTASPDLFTALSVSTGPVVCRLVDCGSDAENRRLVWAFDATLPLSKFAVLCAQRALELAQSMTGWERPVELSRALQLKSGWDNGEVTAKDLCAARESVWSLRQRSGHTGQNRPLTSVCIDEALLAAGSAIGILPMESDRNSAWKCAYGALKHAYRAFAAAHKVQHGDDAEVNPELLRLPLVKALEELLISELSFSELRGAASPRRLDSASGALFDAGFGDVANPAVN